MLQFLSDEELENSVTAITMRNSEAGAIEDAIYSLEQLFRATPGACRQDLELLVEAIASLKIINGKIENEEGYEKIYNLYRREAENNG